MLESDADAARLRCRRRLLELTSSPSLTGTNGGVLDKEIQQIIYVYTHFLWFLLFSHELSILMNTTNPYLVLYVL